MSQSPQVTILFDNEPGLPGLTQLWGFAALLEIGERARAPSLASRSTGRSAAFI